MNKNLLDSFVDDYYCINQYCDTKPKLQSFIWFSEKYYNCPKCYQNYSEHQLIFFKHQLKKLYP